MTEYKVSFRYARALLEQAIQEGSVEIIYKDFLRVSEVFASSRDLRSMVESPVFQLWRKLEIVKLIFDEIKISKLSMDFLLLLINKGRGELIMSIIEQFENQYNIYNKNLTIEVESAIELTDEIKNKIITRIADWTKKKVLPKFIINPTLRGGFLVKIDDWVYDSSIKNQLEVLYKSLAEG
ncbi:MAG: ATP synthase F1 subunit delta [FCB group bacterium]|jgi:F-type H+-transporting ATPase subunit delta